MKESRDKRVSKDSVKLDLIAQLPEKMTLTRISCLFEELDLEVNGFLEHYYFDFDMLEENSFVFKRPIMKKGILIEIYPPNELFYYSGIIKSGRTNHVSVLYDYLLTSETEYCKTEELIPKQMFFDKKEYTVVYDDNE